MNGHDGQIDIVEQFVIKFHSEASTEEDHDLLVTIFAKESEQ